MKADLIFMAAFTALIVALMVTLAVLGELI